MNFFTKATYLEVLAIFNDEQLQRESQRHRKNAKQGPLKNSEAMRSYLISRANNLKDDDHMNDNIQFTISEACDDLVTVISESLRVNADLIEHYRKELDIFKEKPDAQPEREDGDYDTISQSIESLKNDLTLHITGQSETYRDVSVMDKIKEIEAHIGKLNENITSVMDEGIDINFVNSGQPLTVDVPAESSQSVPDDIFTVDQESVQETTAQRKAKRVLILTDSRNRDFDAKLLKGPIECKVYPMYHLQHLTQVEPLISESDIVLISSGVNDITQWKWDGTPVANFLMNFLTTAEQKFPNTQFLINSIAPTNLVAKINDIYLHNIHKINSIIFNFCLSSSNATFFDNENLQWDHISKDGIHLTLAGKQSLSKCWVEVVLRCFGYRRGPVPLRPSFKLIANRRYRY